MHINTCLIPYTHILRGQIEKHQFSKQIKWTAFAYREWARNGVDDNTITTTKTMIFHRIHYITQNTRFMNVYLYFIWTIFFGCFSSLNLNRSEFCLKTLFHSFSLTPCKIPWRECEQKNREEEEAEQLCHIVPYTVI